VPPAEAEAAVVLRTAQEIVEAGHFERLLYQGPGATETYTGLSRTERKKLCAKADEVGLCHKPHAEGGIMVYTSGAELLYGVIPYSFEELGLHDDLVLALLQWTPKPLEQATHIQAQAIPKILAGEDVAIQAESGSGKTLAYLLPAAQAALERARPAQSQREHKSGAREAEAGVDEGSAAEAGSAGGPASAVCYRVLPHAGPSGLRSRQRPEEFAPAAGGFLKVGDEFMAKSATGSPGSVQWIEMADGRGWIPWDRRNPRLRLALSGVEMKVGQLVEATEELTYGSGDKVTPGVQGVIERVLPMVGVRWEGLDGVKAVDCPRRVLKNPRSKKGLNFWAQCAPDTLIITANRELCEQTAEVARQLGRLLPRDVQEEWTVAVAIGAPPGVGKKRHKRGNEQWPFPKGQGAPKVLVATLEFMGYFFHKRHIPLWANIRYVVYDEVDRLVAGSERLFLSRIKVMFLRAQRTEGKKAQSVLVACTMPSQGTNSTRLRIGQWMPHALRALPRPDLLHRNHPMVIQTWQYVPEGFDAKVQLLVDFLKRGSDCARKKKPGKKSFLSAYHVREKTIVFCNASNIAAQLAEILATTYNFEKVGLFVSGVGGDERRKRLQMFRDGDIRLMVTTDLLSRGIDIPDLACAVQFDYAKNIVDHLHRIGRVSRAANIGRTLNIYDDHQQGGKMLAEAVQDVGSAPLDGLFSRNRGLRKARRRREAFKQMLLMQGLPLPAHLQDGAKHPAPPLLAEVLAGTGDDEGPEAEDDGEWVDDEAAEEAEDEEAAQAEDAEADYVQDEEAHLGVEEKALEASFESASDEEKDREYESALKDLSLD